MTMIKPAPIARPPLRHALVFSTGMFIGAVCVSGMLLSAMFSRARDQAAASSASGDGSLILMVLACGVSAFIAAFIVWRRIMGNKETRLRAVIAGPISAALTFLVLGLVVAFMTILTGSGPRNDVGEVIAGSVIVSYFAITFASLPAAFVGGIVGWLSSLMIAKAPAKAQQ